MLNGIKFVHFNIEFAPLYDVYLCVLDMNRITYHEKVAIFKVETWKEAYNELESTSIIIASTLKRRRDSDALLSNQSIGFSDLQSSTFILSLKHEAL